MNRDPNKLTVLDIAQGIDFPSTKTIIQTFIASIIILSILCADIIATKLICAYIFRAIGQLSLISLLKLIAGK